MKSLEKIGLWLGGLTLLALIVCAALYAFAFVATRFIP